MLFEENSPKDLALRGFTREEILNITGIDVGYHNRKIRTEISGIDRDEYRIEYVKSKFCIDDYTEILSKISNGEMETSQVMRFFGVRETNHFTMTKLFNGLGLCLNFEIARKNLWQHKTTEGRINKYGVDNLFKLPKYQEKAANTRKEKYGGKYTLSEDSCLKDIARETMRKNMEDSLFYEKVMQRRSETRKKNYVPKEKIIPDKTPISTEEKMRIFNEAMMKKYGVKWARQIPRLRNELADYRKEHPEEIQQKTINTNISKYGVPYYAMTEKQRNIQKNRMLSSEYQQHIIDVRRQKGTLSISKAEIEIGNILKEHFDEKDIFSQYVDDRYPWHVDFYIKSRDLFIEINGIWTHGGKWFCETEEDIEKVDFWRNKDNKYYNLAIKQWTEFDVKKRKRAAQMKLNYIVFWGNKACKEAIEWVNQGMPDAHDWEKEYSWKK